MKKVSWEEIISAFRSQGGRRWKDDFYRGPCPAHGGSNRSALVIRREGDTVLLHCFSHGCSWRSVLDALGFSGYALDENDPNDLDAKIRRLRHRYLRGYEVELFGMKAFLALTAQRARTAIKALRPADGSDAAFDEAAREIFDLMELVQSVEDFLDRVSVLPKEEQLREYAVRVHRWSG